MMMRKVGTSIQREKEALRIPPKNKYFFILLTITVLLASGFYLHLEWNKYQGLASSEAIQLAQSLESLLHPEHIEELSGSAEDLNNPTYVMEKHSLARLIEVTNPIRFAYLLGERNGSVVFLMDSEPPDSPDYSPPGQIFYEAQDSIMGIFRSGETVLTAPTTDRWGTWISALVPIKDPTDGRVIAALGIDYSAAEWYAALWKQMIPDFMVVFVVLLLYFSLLYIGAQHARLNRLNNKLVFDEALYRSVFEQAPVGIAVMEDKSLANKTDFGDMSINSTYEKILGRNKDELQKVTWVEITHTEDILADLKNFDRFKKGEISGYTIEKRFIKPDGAVVWTNMKISPLLGLDYQHSMHLCLLEDISERKQTELALEESEHREAVILSHLPGLAYRCKYDRYGTMLFVSDGCYALTGYLPESFINNKGLAFNDIIIPEHQEVLYKEWARTVPNRLPYKCEYEITAADGRQKWVLEMGQGVYDEQGEVEALEGIILDISDRKEIEDRLRYINEHDSLTGLYNRGYLETVLEKDAKHKKISKRAVISINLSTVQLLIANYGFQHAQNIIKTAAETLANYCSDQCMLFQTHENRFVFYLKNYKDRNELIDFSEGIANTLEALFVTDRIGGGIGIIEIDQDKELDVDLLLRRLLIASERSINPFDKDFRTCFYDKELEDSVNREGEIRNELLKIAADHNGDDLFLHYQPIFDLKTDSICGFEALARLRTKKLGLVSPVEFIPIAEKNKFIIPIGEKIIIEAFGFLNRLKEAGFENYYVSINVSAIQLLRPDFTARLFGMIDEMRVNPKNVCIEITESIFAVDCANINNTIKKLRGAGLRIDIDDFGTGYSSLAREKELNVDGLKIDKYFIDRLLETDSDKAITGDIISMAHRLGHDAVAEGVEHARQLRYLKEHGCDKV
ncbi:MAG: EAL domain-containing protein [Clostridia bacterium]|nr:EAL domain-containing protein [Clostridia bacterium]